MYKFRSYYKYSFTFIDQDGNLLMCGNDRDDIYRADIDADKEYTLEELEREFGDNVYQVPPQGGVNQ